MVYYVCPTCQKKYEVRKRKPDPYTMGYYGTLLEYGNGYQLTDPDEDCRECAEKIQKEVSRITKNAKKEAVEKLRRGEL